MISSCCKAKVWLMCGDLKLEPDQEYDIFEGITSFYLCDVCDKPCFGIEILSEKT